MFRSQVLLLAAMVSGPLWAQPIAPLQPTSCNELIIAGNSQWPPYVLNQAGQVRGAAIDLADQIATELDIPHKMLALPNQREALQAITQDRADIIVSLYGFPQHADLIEQIEPSFHQDPVRVAVRKADLKRFKRWEDLIGAKGGMSAHFEFEQKFDNFVAGSLSLTKKANLSDALRMVKIKQADYVLGSERQLKYLIQQLKFGASLALSEQLSKPASVYMGFAKHSACYPYVAFFRKRLKDLRSDGTVYNLLQHYQSPTAAASKGAPPKG